MRKSGFATGDRQCYRALASTQAHLKGHLFESVSVIPPPGFIHRRHAVVAFPETDGAVDHLADDVGVPSMTVNGRFITDPERAGGYREMIETVDMLVREELAAQPQ